MAVLARASGRPIAFRDVPHETFVDGMRASGAPEEMVVLTAYLMETVLDGRNATVGDGVRRALGRAPRSIEAFARDAAASDAWNDSATRAREEAC
jgi:hypothetical protein